MKDLQSSRMMWLKGVLFAMIGTIAAILLIVEMPTLKVAIMLALTIWAFCRAYYFAFYVIQRYVDPVYRFSGLWSFAAYCVRKKPKAPVAPP